MQMVFSVSRWSDEKEDEVLVMDVWALLHGFLPQCIYNTLKKKLYLLTSSQIILTNNAEVYQTLEYVCIPECAEIFVDIR